MSQALRNMGPEEQKAAIARRIRQKEHGLGYWAAIDAQQQIMKARKARETAHKVTPMPPITGEQLGEILSVATYGEKLAQANAETQEFVDGHVTGRDSMQESIDTVLNEVSGV